MPFDSMPQGKPWGEPWMPQCPSCRRPIGKNEPTENVRFESDPQHKLEELNGVYHAACAKPYLSMGHALNMLRWRPF